MRFGTNTADDEVASNRPNWWEPAFAINGMNGELMAGFS